MAEPFLGEIRLFGFNFAPVGWATCDGQIMQITQNQALYALLGTTYGGNGTTTFNLPDFQGRTLLHANATYGEGKAGGVETVALATTSELPVHNHVLAANTGPGGSNVPQGNILAATQSPDNTKTAYATAKATPVANLAGGTLSPAGGSAGHNNVQPSLTVNFCIALTGLWPPRN
ncbi:phage tail collar domain protein [Geotalea daltonii FRC-32]|uniref:Phage tail collar domain protein n=1 Tax=Geotalea daltonii (strain DSM 22248 / JCM 15807 / FRC-32) TaxID=316067 RepID=B9M3Z8_GEODF|nr:tail fiber protein [Geotalea daltonii]ACM19641.1 phage tail collar domain protein [Geotalea daltonii FRC-32]